MGARLFLSQENPSEHDQDAKQNRPRIHGRASSRFVALHSGECGWDIGSRRKVHFKFGKLLFVHQFNSTSHGERMTKSDEIRKEMARHPAAGPKAILMALKKRGIKASLALVNAVKYKNPQRRVTMASIMAAKAYSAKVRGLDNAKAALAAYSRLADSR